MICQTLTIVQDSFHDCFRLTISLWCGEPVLLVYHPFSMILYSVGWFFTRYPTPLINTIWLQIVYSIVYQCQNSITLNKNLINLLEVAFLNRSWKIVSNLHGEVALCRPHGFGVAGSSPTSTNQSGRHVIKSNNVYHCEFIRYPPYSSYSRNVDPCYYISGAYCDVGTLFFVSIFIIIILFY